VADQRRRRLRDEAQRWVNPSARSAYVCRVDDLHHECAVVSVVSCRSHGAGRVRWQIELLSSCGKVTACDESRSEKPWHILCDVYAKLLAMLVLHWLVLVSVWRYVDRASQGGQNDRKHARDLEIHFADVSGLTQALTTLGAASAKPVASTRARRIAAFQLLQA